jgi:hypothetical protein
VAQLQLVFEVAFECPPLAPQHRLGTIEMEGRNSVNVNIQDLPANVVARYEVSARACGVSLDAFLRDYLIKNAPASPPAQMSPDEWEKALDECFDSFPPAGPLPDDAFNRENIYGREDKW